MARNCAIDADRLGGSLGISIVLPISPSVHCVLILHVCACNWHAEGERGEAQGSLLKRSLSHLVPASPFLGPCLRPAISPDSAWEPCSSGEEHVRPDSSAANDSSAGSEGLDPWAEKGDGSAGSR